MLHLQRIGVPRAGQRVLHFAPERGLAERLRDIVGAANYEAYDLHPESYGSGTQRFDLCRQAHELPSARYDLIVHSHVLEHLPCNYSAVLFHLHRALASDGLHVCCVPFLEGHYEEQGGRLSNAERKRRFGQEDHVRRFGAADVADTLGMVVRLPSAYDLTGLFPVEALQRANIPDYARSGYSPHSVLVLCKEDLLLR
jgi:phosphoglycolate phosphatase